MADRKPISKKLRFEVLKRDSFKCQYCGATAPEALLEIDHIKPVSKGGKNDILNLIASCSNCNNGKSNKQLDDSSVVSKSRAQMEELQGRREQLEMMMEWKDGLKSLKDDTIEKLAEYWDKMTPGLAINENGKSGIAKMIKRFSVDEITQAMDIAAGYYLRFNEDNKCTHDSVQNAFSKITGICYNKRNPEPTIRQELCYIKGILRKRCVYYFNEPIAMQYLEDAARIGVDVGQIKEMSLRVKNWMDFKYNIISMTEEMTA
jgi:hypothetical protein